MSVYQEAMLVLSVLTIVFGAGGFFWIAKNHIAHAQKSLDRLETEMMEVRQDIALIKGSLGIGIR